MCLVFVSKYNSLISFKDYYNFIMTKSPSNNLAKKSALTHKSLLVL